jgi:hypothetical protein
MKNVLCYHIETNILFQKQVYTILYKLANIHSRIAAFVFKICASGADPGGGAQNMSLSFYVVGGVTVLAVIMMKN